ACDDILSQYQTLPWLKKYVGQPVVLLGGANRSLARMGQKLSPDQATTTLQGFDMSIEKVQQIFSRLRQMSRPERERMAGLEVSRADIIVSGLLPLLNLMTVIHSPNVIFSESGVREGLIAEMMKNNA
ncbi:Ppx/GppA phosphatase family protein, partial [Leuconostoc lactis]|uniref:Ppx/GppA phosphatase family protein n=1 Tax=Leuconostoc lactis TaxID=1246 RepID=UPI00406CDE66